MSLTPRLIKNSQASYIAWEWNGVNESGRVPIGKNVIVKTDKCSPVTPGGVQLPGELIERMNLASESGIVVAIGPDAYRRHDDGTLWEGGKPEPGARVEIERYAGVQIMGSDGEIYRVMSTSCVVAMLDKDAVLYASTDEQSLRTF